MNRDLAGRGCSQGVETGEAQKNGFFQLLLKRHLGPGATLGFGKNGRPFSLGDSGRGPGVGR